MAAIDTVVEGISVYAIMCSDRFQELVDGSARLNGKIHGLDERIEDERDRFEMFMKNSGAARSGRSSLQYRLREASGIRNRFVGFLQTLTRVLDVAIDVAAAMQSHETLPVMPDDIEELDGLVSNLARIITSLLKCSATIRNPHPHDRFSLSAAETDTTYFHAMDIAHIQEKFPLASSAICARLGKANSYRRQYFKYREARHVRLESGTSLANDGQSTVASSIPQALKDGDGPSNEPRFIDEDYQSESGQTMTTITIESGRLPPLPAMSERGPFECPYCYTMIAVTTSKEWEYGIYSDQVSSQKLTSLQETHTSRSSMLYMPPRRLPTEPCPLCEETIRSANSYQSHVGKHQMDLALFTLPNVDYDELLSGGSSESKSSSRSASTPADSESELAVLRIVKAGHDGIRAMFDDHFRAIEKRYRREVALRERGYVDSTIASEDIEEARIEGRNEAEERVSKISEEWSREAERRQPRIERQSSSWLTSEEPTQLTFSAPTVAGGGDLGNGNDGGGAASSDHYTIPYVVEDEDLTRDMVAREMT
ncbi:hypothetical protein PG985_001521 [Apiospora marii]|uniref:Oxidoreductase acuF-like C2H2 type zinc-finger domain-containing protein n=1 Tax=Apiospora marii TaxID=335849 RepID=A0ABR1RIM5_9PEZI